MSISVLGLRPDPRKAHSLVMGRILLGQGKDPPLLWEGPSSAINVVEGKGSNSVLVMIFRVISPNRNNIKTTKSKGKAVITAIKYSAPNRAMLLSFYNHPQPLWVWADETSTSPIKLNLLVDVGRREKASIKGGRSSPERRWGTRSKNRSHPGRAEEEVSLDKLRLPLCDHHEHHD